MPVRRRVIEAWISQAALDAMVTEARRVSPLETGGVLVGYWAPAPEAVVITGCVGPSPKATHSKQRFIPDADSHDGAIARLYCESGGLRTYLGDWHSHPEGGFDLSRRDRFTLKRIAESPGSRAPVPLMVILAGKRTWKLAVWRYAPVRVGARVLGPGVVPCDVKVYAD